MRVGDEVILDETSDELYMEQLVAVLYGDRSVSLYRRYRRHGTDEPWRAWQDEGITVTGTALDKLRAALRGDGGAR